jgi:hypothetical protein
MAHSYSITHGLDQDEKEKRPVKRLKDASPAPSQRFLSPAAGPSASRQPSPSDASSKKLSVLRGTSGKGVV